MSIDETVARYLDRRNDPTARYASFDYCFNYFQSHHDAGRVSDLAGGKALQTSCLQLGFYLASWGMLRGSTQLLGRSARCFVPVIDAIVQAPDALWTADVDGYTSDTIEMILQVGRQLGAILPGGHSHTLVTKTMLGVFGCVPAFDSYFKRGLGVHTFGRRSLAAIAAFHDQHAAEIERHRVQTWDFETGVPTDRLYTRAKVIDMHFFITGAR